MASKRRSFLAGIVNETYKFSKSTDEKVRSSMPPQFGADPLGGVVRKGDFMARRNAQIRRRTGKTV